ncbi:MAG: thioredoxin domain-containing protein [Campylobacterales bacterium]|nr:thioredoxin domain-containing protein [Campylobacterales bacterium]
MSKLLSTTLIATLSLSATSNEAEVEAFIKNHLVKAPRVKVTDIDIINKQSPEELKGWDVYFVNIHAEIKQSPTVTDKVDVPETIFIKDGMAANTLIDIKTGKDYHKLLKPDLKPEIYNDKHLFAGNKDAKHKIVVFSDPQCPFCQEKVPEIYQAVKEHPETFAMYYYHLPLLKIHPVSDIIVRAMLIEQERKNFDKVIDMYTLDIDPSETNLTTVVEKLNKQFSLNLTEKEIDSESIAKELEFDKDMATKSMVTGTPTVYVDGKWDMSRNEYKALIPGESNKK